MTSGRRNALAQEVRQLRRELRDAGFTLATVQRRLDNIDEQLNRRPPTSGVAAQEGTTKWIRPKAT